MNDRVPVRRTAKLFIGGAFPRSESGRTYEVTAADGRPLAHVARASRKDLRDAVVAARGAQPGWAAMTAYNRGQILYRVAELMEGRRAQFEVELRDAGAAGPERGVNAAIDRWVWYAGWADKLAQVLGGCEPGGGPLLQLHAPRAHGRGRDRRPGGAVAPRPRLPARARDRERQRGGRARERARAAAGRLARRGARHVRRPGRRGEPPHRPHGRVAAVARGTHGRERDRRHGGLGGGPRRGRDPGGREREAHPPRSRRRSVRPGVRRARTRSPPSWR